MDQGPDAYICLQLARQRVDLEHARGRERNAELVTMQNESVSKQEAERQRVSAQIEAERRATEQHKVGSGVSRLSADSTPKDILRLAGL